MKQIIIVGAGASGLMAAIKAAAIGAAVLAGRYVQQGTAAAT